MSDNEDKTNIIDVNFRVIEGDKPAEDEFFDPDEYDEIDEEPDFHVSPASVPELTFDFIAAMLEVEGLKLLDENVLTLVGSTINLAQLTIDRWPEQDRLDFPYYPECDLTARYMLCVFKGSGREVLRNQKKVIDRVAALAAETLRQLDERKGKLELVEPEKE